MYITGCIVATTHQKISSPEATVHIAAFGCFCLKYVIRREFQ